MKLVAVADPVKKTFTGYLIRSYQGSNLGFGKKRAVKIPSDNHYTI